MAQRITPTRKTRVIVDVFEFTDLVCGRLVEHFHIANNWAKAKGLPIAGDLILLLYLPPS